MQLDIYWNNVMPWPRVQPQCCSLPISIRLMLEKWGKLAMTEWMKLQHLFDYWLIGNQLKTLIPTSLHRLTN